MEFEINSTLPFRLPVSISQRVTIVSQLTPAHYKYIFMEISKGHDQLISCLSIAADSNIHRDNLVSSNDPL